MDLQKQREKLKDFKHHENLSIVHSRPINYLLTKLRNKKTTPEEYMVYGDRLMSLLAEEALCRLPSIKLHEVETPCGKYVGLVQKKKEKEKLCLVSIVRSGDIMLESVRKLTPGCRVGKILIQRDESSVEKNPILIYKKLPHDISQCHVFLLDPMLATGGSCVKAIEVLVSNKVLASNITFLNLIGCEDGLKRVFGAFPKIKVICAEIDDHLNEHKFICPGLGDYGDRYFGTEPLSSDDELEEGC